jgi:organic radical activating enzyme
MNKITDTISLCEYCYRHIPAVKFEHDGSIWLGKTCPMHGYIERLVEVDAGFYLGYNPPKKSIGSYLIEVTNRCNLTCPHCYQEPNNSDKDPTVESIAQQVQSWQNDGYNIVLAGAEPTVRKDLDQLIDALQHIPGKKRNIIVLTNGVNLARLEYAKKFINFKNLSWTIGLNHPSYQGSVVRKKQIQGIKNCIDLGLSIKNISYTLEDLDQLEYCMKEIQQFHPSTCENFRIRVGADIGRNLAGPQIYLSQLVSAAKQLATKYNWSYRTNESSGIRAHYPVYINGVYIKLIQWPDAKTLDLDETQTEAWADLFPDLPISPLVHQVMLRDAAVNNGMSLPDIVPKEYRR